MINVDTHKKWNYHNSLVFIRKKTMAENQAQAGCGGFIVFIMAIVNVAIGASVSSNIILYAKLFPSILSIAATINT